MKKFKSLKVGLAVVAVGGLLALTTPAVADTAEGITETVPAASVPQTTLDSDAAIIAQLKAIEGTQTPEEIAAIMEGPSYTLGEDGEFTAAIAAPESIGARAISIRGPGCATGDACANSVNGYYGTGVRDINLKNITKISSGNENTTWWYNNNATGYNLTPGTTTFINATNLTRITRGK